MELAARKRWVGRMVAAGTFSTLALLVTSGPVAADIFVVDDPTDLGDADPGDDECSTVSGTCTLRAAVEQANNNADLVDTIELEANTYELLSSLFINSGTVTVTGEGVDSTILDGVGLTRHFSILGARLQVENATLTNGYTAGDGGSIHAESGEVFLDSVAMVDNRADVVGGGLYVNADSEYTITKSEIGNNKATISGGGIISWGTGTIRQSLIVANEARRGGGVANANEGALTMSNVTVTANTTKGNLGGVAGIDSEGDLSLNNVTITDNHASDGAGPTGGLSGSRIRMNNTIIAGNTMDGNPADCNAGFTRGSNYNMIGEVTGCLVFPPDPPWRYNVDPELQPLADNGGPTRTHALATTSQAIDWGRKCRIFDQRGVIRGLCDIGAFEINRPIVNPRPLNLTPTEQDLDPWRKKN